MVHIDKPTLPASSVGIAETLYTSSNNQLMLKVLRPFTISSVQPNAQTMDEHGIHIMVSIDRATIAPGKEPPINAYQRLPVE